MRFYILLFFIFITNPAVVSANWIPSIYAQEPIEAPNQTSVLLSTDSVTEEQAIAPTNQITNPSYSIFLDNPTIAKGYTVSAFDDAIKFSLVPGILTESSRVLVEQISADEMTMPWKLSLASPVYQFEFANKDAYQNENPFYIQVNYNPPTSEKFSKYKQVFFYDKNQAAWRPLPTTDYPDNGFVRSLIHLPYARLAVFEYDNILLSGKASWYAYKGGDFAASPDFPKGSVLRVKNTENGKTVDITVNDWGPDRKVHLDRAIDLDKVAFSKIADLGDGIIAVEIEPLYIADEQEFGVKGEKISNQPIVDSASAVVIRESDSAILFAKNASSTMPIASLSKLAAIKAFFDFRPSLSEVVVYSTADEKNNYQYVDEPWRIAKIKLQDGDTMTLENLVYAALVGSANNAVETLARAGGMGRVALVDKMNENAVDFGAENTYFIEPTGLATENISTAYEYAIMAKELFTNPLIQKVSAMNRYDFSLLNREKSFSIKNTNNLVLKKTRTISGSKTGYLDEAGHCLAVRVETNKGENVIAVILGGNSKQAVSDEMEELLDYAETQN